MLAEIFWVFRQLPCSMKSLTLEPEVEAHFLNAFDCNVCPFFVGCLSQQNPGSAFGQEPGFVLSLILLGQQDLLLSVQFPLNKSFPLG